MSSELVNHSYASLPGLPSEVRQMILEDVFLLSCESWCHTKNGPSRISFRGISDNRTYPQKSTFWGTERMSNIFRLSRQIYHECMNIVYGGNFVFDLGRGVILDQGMEACLSKSKDYIKYISLQINRSQMTQFHVHPRTDSDIRTAKEHWMRLRAMLKCLETVEIQLVFYPEALVGSERAASRNAAMKKHIIEMGRFFHGTGVTLVCGNFNHPEEHHELVQSLQEALRAADDHVEAEQVESSQT